LPIPAVEDIALPSAPSVFVAPLLDVRAVEFRYRQNQILNEVSFAIRPGECVALLGSNGAGKSTLMRLCAGLIEPAAGTISFAGCSSRPWPTAVRRQVGIIFQKHQLVPQSSVLTNVIHGRMGFPEGWRCCWQLTAPEGVRQEAMRCLEQVDLAHKAMQPARSLSGGESQRVAIARALIRQSELILADEPTASLDPSAGLEILQRLRVLNRQRGVTMLIATHDLARALEFTDRVIGLRNGEIVVDESTVTMTVERLQNLYGEGLRREEYAE